MTMVSDTNVDGADPNYDIHDAEECKQECMDNPECTAVDFKYEHSEIYITLVSLIKVSIRISFSKQIRLLGEV